MDFFEAEGQRAMERFGIPTVRGILYSDKKDMEEITYPCVVKAQVLSGKRGKAGGILFAKDFEEMKAAVEKITLLNIQGKPPVDCLIVPKLDIMEEHYLGLILDRSSKEVIMIYSPFGGMDIEELAETRPDCLVKLPVTESFTADIWNKETRQFDLPEAERRDIFQIAVKLRMMFFAVDGISLEINPLARTKDGDLIAADAKMVIDDNALYRQKDLPCLSRPQADNAREAYASEHRLAYVDLEETGAIGVLAGGAGIGMATVDSIKYFGYSPFNFLDLGGGVTADKTYHALTLLLNIEEIQGIVVNIFGGINNCLTMAEGITKAYQEAFQRGIKKELVVKSRGFNQAKGWELYDALDITQIRYGTTDDAVKRLIALLYERGGIRK